MTIRFVVMVRDPLLASTADPEYAVVSPPLGWDAACEARCRYAAEMRLDRSTRDVQVFVARWEVLDRDPAPYRPLNGFRVSS